MHHVALKTSLHNPRHHHHHHHPHPHSPLLTAATATATAVVAISSEINSSAQPSGPDILIFFFPFLLAARGAKLLGKHGCFPCSPRNVPLWLHTRPCVSVCVCAFPCSKDAVFAGLAHAARTHTHVWRGRGRGRPLHSGSTALPLRLVGWGCDKEVEAWTRVRRICVRSA